MDQVKVALAVMKKYHFWLLIVVVVLVGGGVWAMASSNLAKQFEDRKTELEGARKSVTDIAGQANPPNQKVVDAIKQKNGALKEEVQQAWELLYKEQKKNNTWPEELGEEFGLVINSLGPEDNIPGKYRELYWTFISNHLETLDDIIDRRKPKRDTENGQVAGRNGGMGDPMMSASTGMAGEGTGREAEWVGKIFWDDAQRVKQGFMWSSRPETIQVRTAQEDLWVYEALLRIIKNTNAGATHHYNAAIKTIRELQIGRAAAAAFQQSASRLKLSALGSGGGGGMDMGMGMEMSGSGEEMMMSGDPMGGGAMGGGAMGAEGGMSGADLPPEERLRKQLYDGRYVDQNGEPLMADADPPFAEFKMMPVRMLLIMDQRKIPKLLVECANSSMPVEVHRVVLNPGRHATINFSRFGGGSSGDGYGGGMGMGSGMSEMDSGMGMNRGMGMGGDYGGGGGGSYGGGDGMSGMEMGGMSEPGMMQGGGYDDGGMGGAMAGPSGKRTYSQHDLGVEVEGIIYIFNPPDRDKLGTGTAREEAAAPQLTTPDTPAASRPSRAAAPGTPAPEITVTPPTEPPPAAAPAEGSDEAPATPPPGTSPPAAAPDAPAAGPPAAAPPAKTPPEGVAPGAGE